MRPRSPLWMVLAVYFCTTSRHSSSATTTRRLHRSSRSFSALAFQRPSWSAISGVVDAPSRCCRGPKNTSRRFFTPKVSAPTTISNPSIMTLSAATLSPTLANSRLDEGDRDDDDGAALSIPATRAQMVSDLEACGKRLRQGHLVAFPTETVYGLGCHALDPEAVLKVFAAKERPLSDPLIVHVLEPDEAFELWDVAPESVHRRILALLCQTFWPGPLTLIAPATSQVPSCVTAGTGFVACRSPSHVVARELLREAQIPLGAPSANKFGHVSPTTALHVWDDLWLEDVWIIPDVSKQSKYGGGGGGCDVGVESTVAKVIVDETANDDGQQRAARVQILRQGKVSAQDIRACLRKANLHDTLVETVRRSTAENAVNVAPGQTLRHYSPNVPSFLVEPSACLQELVLPDDNRDGLISASSRLRNEKLREAAVIDYGGRLKQWRGAAGAYRDLSPHGDPAAAARVIFETLRWAEQLPVARILFPSLGDDEVGDEVQGDSLLLAVRDRLTRAASGVAISSLDEL